MTVCNKDKIIEIINLLPPDTSIEEVMERLYLFSKIEKGIEQAKTGQTMSLGEAKKKLNKWFE